MSTPIEGRKTEIVRGLVTEFSLDMLLKIIKLARSTYYYHLNQLDQSDKDYDVKAEIQAIFTEHKEITAIVEWLLNYEIVVSGSIIRGAAVDERTWFNG